MCRLLHLIEAKIDCGDPKEVFEIFGSLWEAVWKRRLVAAKFEAQDQGCSGWDREMVEEDGMYRVRKNSELFQVG